MANSSRYRYIEWLGGRILENRELNTLQSIDYGVNSSGSKVSYNLDQLYRPGATQNVLVAISGLTITISAIDGTKPMAVFVRGRWETFTSGDVSSLTLSSVQTQVFLNYALNIVTYNGASGTLTDASLVDATTGQPVAQMGELDFTFGVTDTSGVSLNATTQLEKNTSPIVVWEFTNSGTALTQVILDNVEAPAYGGLGVSGLVSLSTSTSNGEAAASDDPRFSSSLTSVEDANVRTPISPGGTNADGSAIYNLTSDPGGISAAKIVWVAGTELVSDFLSWVKTQVTSILATLTSHIGVGLGSSATHPFPTAAQVGAAPASHVGMQLGLSGSHPPIVTADSGGFEVDESSAVVLGGAIGTDPAFSLKKSGTVVTGIMHNGDLVSTLLNALTVAPGGTPIVFSGTFGRLQDVAQTVADHVNQNSHANPHGLALSDLGVNSGTSFLAAPNGYIVLPPWLGSIIIQWGLCSATIAGIPNATPATFPIHFPNAVFGVYLGQVMEIGQNTSLASVYGAPTKSGFTCVMAASGSTNGPGAPFYVAIGN